MTEQDLHDVLARWGKKNKGRAKLPPYGWAALLLTLVAATGFIAVNQHKHTIPFIEYKDNVHVGGQKSYKPGETVLIFYSLRRNRDCRTDVEAQLLSAETGSIDTSLTRIIPATRAPITEGFITFKVDVRIPMDTPAGFWAYQGIMDPIGCPEENTVVIPRSEFFEVK